MSVCEDLSEFLDTLKNQRLVDDRIVYALNTSIPTQSFSSKLDGTANCKDLFAQINDFDIFHSERDQGLQQCLDFTVKNVDRLKEQRKAAPDNYQLQKLLKREQTKLREIQTQLDVEEVIRGRTLKIYNERCRAFYKPEHEKQS